jgi:hypothetical protein
MGILEAYLNGYDYGMDEGSILGYDIGYEEGSWQGYFYAIKSMKQQQLKREVSIVAGTIMLCIPLTLLSIKIFRSFFLKQKGLTEAK